MKNTIIKTIEQSEMWLNLNKKVKALCEAHNIEMNSKEYQAVRNMMICKVMAEDKTVCEAAAKEMYNECNA